MADGSAVVLLGRLYPSQPDWPERVYALYRREGPGFASLLDGEFVIFIWDALKGSPVVARDRAGVIPLFVHRHKGEVLLSDHVEGLLTLGLRPAMNWDAVADFFTFFWTLGAKTFFQGVQRFPAGAVSVGETVRTYWSYRQGGREGEELKGPLGRALGRAVEKRVEAETSLGCHLSGGVDSSVIARLACDACRGRLHTYAIRVPGGNDETPWILRMLEALGTEHHWIEPGPGDILSAIPDVARILGEPSCYPSVLSRYFLEREATHRVILNGRGVDELFSGYNWHLPPHLEGHLGRREVLSRKEIGRVFPPLRSHGYRPRRAYQALHDQLPHYTPLEKSLHVDYHTLLRSWLLVEYAFSSAVHHVASMPALDASVMDIAARARSEVKATAKETKVLFREAFRHLLPEEILTRPKMGLNMPLSALLRHEAGGMADVWLQEAQKGEFGELDVDHLLAQLERHRRGEIQWGWQFWGVFCYMHWKKEYFVDRMER